MKANNIIDTIGNTPLVKLQNTFEKNIEVWIKLEKMNPGGSIKDRIAMAMVEDAENKNILNKDSIIIEPTSGNTGVGLAMVAAAKKYRLLLVMPESMSVERRKLMAAYGAEFVLTPKEEGMPGAIQKAFDLHKKYKNSWIPSQFENEANIEIHRKATAKEILKDLEQPIDFIFAGVGTGGHLTGVSEVVKERYPNCKTFAVEPKNSAVISGESPGSHKIQGIGAGFIPKNLHTELIDNIVKIDDNEALLEAKNLALNEGILCGISTGANISAIKKKLNSIPENSVVVTFNYDTGERYLSIENLF
ncbi:MAG: cysteine synthase A [Bacteroidales bacterium]